VHDVGLAELEEENSSEDAPFSGFDRITAAAVKERIREIRDNGEEREAADELAARLRALSRRSTGRAQSVWRHGALSYDPDSSKVSRASPYSGTVSRSLHHFVYGAFTLFSRLSQNRSTIMKIFHSAGCPHAALQPRHIDGLGSSDFARRYFRNLS